jgi:3-hydroxyisobutyrate dehydrogenase-like beta-hydroxyacid dehydrogenase
MHATDTGDATLMVGCNSQEAFDRVLPILRAMAKYTFHMGELGAGHAMKTLNNYIMASGYTALADSLVVGQKFGLDPIQMIDVLNVGTGSNFPAKDTFKNDAMPRTYASGFQLALLIKDLGITKELMENVGFRTLLPGLIQEGLKHAMGKVSGPDADHTEGLKGWEDRAGIKLRTGRPEGKTVTAIKSKL